jgi:hypothetical protein
MSVTICGLARMARSFSISWIVLPILGFDLVALEAGEPLQTQLENRAGLRFRQPEALLHALRRVGRIGARADQRHQLVDVIERDAVTLEDVGALLGLVEVELRAPHHDFAPVQDVVVDDLEQVDGPRPVVDQGEHVDAERLLHLGVVEELVEDDTRVRVLLELDHHPHAAPVGLVAKIRDPLQVAFLHQVGDAFDHRRLVHLVGDLGHHDAFALALGVDLDLGLGAHHEPAAAGAVGVADAGPAIDDAAGRESPVPAPSS